MFCSFLSHSASSISGLLGSFLLRSKSSFLSGLHLCFQPRPLLLWHHRRHLVLVDEVLQAVAQQSRRANQLNFDTHLHDAYL